MVPKSLGEKIIYLSRNETLMGFLGLLSPIRIFVGPLGITRFCQTNLGVSPLGVGSTSGRICKACATPCHGEAQSLGGLCGWVVPCWMYLFSWEPKGPIDTDTPEIRP